MGTSTSTSQLVGKLDKFARALGDTRPGLTAAAAAGKATFLAAGAGAVGVKPAGKRKAIGARYDLRGSGFKASATVTYTGPAHLLNNPTKPHVITARRARARRSKRGALALTIGPNVRASANHPGTRGKGFAQRAKATVAKQSPAIYSRAGITAPLKGVFR